MVKFTKQEKNGLAAIVAILAIALLIQDSKTRNANANTSRQINGYDSQGKSY